jgi:hypothetical protein
MRIFLLIYLLVHCLNTYCQTNQILGNLIPREEIINIKFLTVSLQEGDSSIRKTATDSLGHFSFSSIRSGTYYFIITQAGRNNFTTDSFHIFNDTSLNITYPQPCSYSGEKPKCLDGHKDNIVPISYGLPTVKAMKRAKKGTIFLGGCIVPYCAPKFYCKLHKREL